MKTFLKALFIIVIFVTVIIGFCIVSQWDYEEYCHGFSIIAFPGALLTAYYRFVSWVIRKFNLQVRVIKIFPNFYMGIAFPKGGKMTNYELTIQIFNDRIVSMMVNSIEEAHEIISRSCLNENDRYSILDQDGNIVETEKN